MPPCFKSFGHHFIEVRDNEQAFFFYFAVLFPFFVFHTLNPLKFFKLGISHIDRSPVFCSLARPETLGKSLHLHTGAIITHKTTKL